MKQIILALSIILIGLFFSGFYWYTYTPRELTFSDGAHFAVIARQILNTQQYTTKFSFFNQSAIRQSAKASTFPASILPLTPLTIAASFRLFGTSDFSATLPAMIFFSFTGLLIFLLGRRYTGWPVALIGTLIFFTAIPFLDYSTSAASEPLFTFLILLSFWFFVSSYALATPLFLGSLFMAFLTRQHAFIYALGFWVVFLISNRHRSRRFIAALSTPIVLILVWWILFYAQGTANYFVKLLPLNQLYVILTNTPLVPANTSLRLGESVFSLSIIANLGVVLSKLFYNSYNLIKLLPNIFPPFLLPFVVLSLFLPKVSYKLKLFFSASFVINLLIVALSLPAYRYLHPLLPFVILLGISGFAQLTKKLRFAAALSFVLFVLIPLFSLVIDTRFVQQTHHFYKPSLTKVLAQRLADSTHPGSVIITNLDVWGSWFGDRTTIWFPLSPEQVATVSAGMIENPVDYIYLTSYKATDENSYIGPSWQSLLDTPPSLDNDFLKQNYQILSHFVITPEENYQNIPASATLLVRSIRN